MKRALTGALLFFLLLPLAAAAADDGHTHSFSLVTETPATCTAQGAKVWRCGCGTVKTEVLEALGHDFATAWTVDREPTCYTEGLKTRHCTRCDAVTDLLTIKTTNHSFTYTQVEPTCTASGYRHRVCDICGDTMDDQYVSPLGHEAGLWVVEQAATCETAGLRSRSCTRCGVKMETLPIEKTGHTFADTVVPPTCTEQGYTLHTCRSCGAQKQDKFVKANGHSFPETGQQTKAPTCTEKGEMQLVCTVCGSTEQKTVPALGHDYSTTPTVDRAPSCTAKGEQSYHCLRCDARKNVISLDRVAHTPQKDDVSPTCTKSGTRGRVICAVCGKVIEAGTTAPALGHDYVQTAVISEATCTSNGSATVTCSRCGNAKNQTTPSLGHQFDPTWVVDKAPTCTAQGEQSHYCTRCGKRSDVTPIPRTDHQKVYDVVTPPTCTEPGKSSGAHCAYCGKELEKAGTIPATGHSFVPQEIYLEPSCTTVGRALGRCSVCGAQQEITLPALGHDFAAEWTVDKAPTCTAQGEQSHHCTRCGKRQNVTALPRTGHTVAVDKAKSATCLKDGKTAGSHCSVCGKVLQKQETVKALGHKVKATRTPATMKKNGKIVQICKRCGKTVEKETISRIQSVKLEKARYTFDGKRKTPAVIVKDKAGNTLKVKRDYTVSYEKGRKKIGVYTVTVTFRRNYTGEKTLRLQIVPRKPTGLDAAQSTTAVTLSWQKVSGATGYAVYEKIGKKSQKLGTTTGLYYRIKDRAAGQKYTFYVVALAKSGKTTLRSDPSSDKLTATKPLPVSLSVSRSGQTAVLRWNNAGDCDYEIYYAPKKNGRQVCIGTTDKTTFTTGAYPRGSRACFKVKAVVRSSTGTLSTQNSQIRQIYL